MQISSQDVTASCAKKMAPAAENNDSCLEATIDALFKTKNRFDVLAPEDDDFFVGEHDQEIGFVHQEAHVTTPLVISTLDINTKSTVIPSL